MRVLVACVPDRAAVVAFVAETLELFAYADALTEGDDTTHGECAEHVVGALESAGWLKTTQEDAV